MRRIDKGALELRDAISLRIREALDELNGEIERYNSALAEHREAIEAAQAKLNEQLDEARTWRDDIVSLMESYASERSDKWTESDAGEAYESWKQEFENAELDEIEIETPEEIELVDGALAEVLDNLPETPKD